MATNWQTIRELMLTAIDFAEAVESKGFSEEDRSIIVQANGRSISLYDLMVSAHTLPEALRYHIIRQRHDKGADAAYISDFARIMRSMGDACAELVGAADSKPADKQIRETISWYRNYALPLIEKALDTKAS